MNAIPEEGDGGLGTRFYAFNGQGRSSLSQEFQSQEFPSQGCLSQERLSVVQDADTITVSGKEGQGAPRAFRCRREDGRTVLAPEGAQGGTAQAVPALFAVLEWLLSAEPATSSVELELAADDPLGRRLVALGVARPVDGKLLVEAALFWQLRPLWLRGERSGAEAYPFSYVVTGGKRHPLRPAKPQGEVYARHIPWLGQTISFRTVDIEGDLDLFHRWMNDPRVAYFWNEDGDLDHHRRYLQGLADDPHMLSLIGAFDGAPFGYFEIYWAKENRLAPFYDVQDYDRGWHVVVGEDAFRGRPFLTAWLPSLMHFMFLDDCRTMRIVGEPRADHQQQIRNLERSGFANVKTFDFPHKRATLVMLLRERFFGERLWIPSVSGPDAASKP